jgi:DNA-binding IclR family transcriptional regulator
MPRLPQSTPDKSSPSKKDVEIATKQENEGLETNGSTSLVSLALLEVLIDANDELGVTQLAQRLGIPKARVHRHLTALRAESYVTQSEKTSRYRIGWRLFLLGQKLVKQFDVVQLARPIMQELRDLVSHTVVLTTYNESHVVVLDLIRGRSPLEIFLSPGTEYLLHASAQGKVVLAYGDEKITKAVLEKPLNRCTSHTIVDVDRLKSEIQLVQQKGWAEAPEELFIGVNALAAPIFQHDKKLFGALAIVGSIHYLPAQARSDMVANLAVAAARISEAFGNTVKS